MLKIIADPNIPGLEVFSGFADVIRVPGRDWSNDLVLDAECLLTRSVTQIDEALLANSRVRFVGTATSGFDHVDRDYLKQQGIAFSYCPGSNAKSVAEYILSALIVCKRSNQKLDGMTAGIIGCGHVGGRVAKLLEAIGINCILNDPPLKEQTNDSRYRPLGEALGTDIVSLHTPLTYAGNYSTYGLISEPELQQIKPDALFINAARGGVVDETALLNKIQSCPELKTVIDCWVDEPVVNPGLLRRVSLGTPHIAGYSYDGKLKATAMLYDAVCNFFGINVEQPISAKPSGLVVRLSPGESEEHALKKAILAAYDIRDDNQRMKALSGLSSKAGGEAFDGLRRNYPVRHEFDKFEIEITDKMPRLENELREIGFTVRGNT